MNKTEKQVLDYLNENKDELFSLLSKLLKFDSQNFITHGREKECQEYITDLYRKLGLETEIYSPDSIQGIKEHPGYLPGRGMEDRPDVTGIWYGEDEKNIIYLSLSPGVGIVYFQNRKMVLGKNGITGEAGHMSLDINGPVCYCGNRGCFELYCGELAIIKKGYTLLEGPNRCEILYKLVNLQDYPMNIETLFTARNLGSIKVHGVLTEIARYLGSALVTLFNIFDPDRIVISGNLVNFDDYVFNTALMEAKSLILCQFSRDMNISTTHLKTGEIEKGICAFMLDKLIDNLI